MSTFSRGRASAEPRSMATGTVATGQQHATNNNTKKKRKSKEDGEVVEIALEGCFSKEGASSPSPAVAPAWCAWIRRNGQWQLATATSDGRVQAHEVPDPDGTGSHGTGCTPLALLPPGGDGEAEGDEGSKAPLSYLAASADGRTLVACQDQYVKVRVV